MVWGYQFAVGDWECGGPCTWRGVCRRGCEVDLVGAVAILCCGSGGDTDLFEVEEEGGRCVGGEVEVF